MPWVQRPRPGIPSYETNFAGPDRLPPANPNLWDGLVYNWHGPLGVTGIGTDDIKDTSGRQNHGTPSGMDASDWVMMQRGYVLQFDGDNDNGILVPDAASLDLTYQMTLAAWIYPQSVTGFQSIILKGNFNTAGNYALWMNGVKLRAYRDAVGVETGAAAFTINTWVHAALVFDGTNVNYYINGKPHGSPVALASAGDVNASQLAIGRSESVSPYEFTGFIESASAWNRDLDPNEIQQLFQDSHAIPRPMQRLFVGGGAAAPAGAIMKQLQGSNVGADLFNGSLI